VSVAVSIAIISICIVFIVAIVAFYDVVQQLHLACMSISCALIALGFCCYCFS